MVTKHVFDFLSDLQANNDKEWFAANKDQFVKADAETRSFFKAIFEELKKIDSLEKLQIFRIYRDVRFSKDKSPYKKYLSAWYSRTKPFYRGSYYIHIEPGNSFVEGGFWEPNAQDLLRIRKELELDASEMRRILAGDQFKIHFGTLAGEELKTAPKGFDKEHPAIDLLRKKQFLVIRRFSNKQVLDKNFLREVIRSFMAMRTFFDYMTDVLTTNVNGESTIE